jgi:hypothetical protein
MLSEVRYYGQGVIVAEQIPTKLTPDVIKNTNLKIVHRLLAKDDRDMVAATMNVDEQKSRFLSILQRGNALVYAEGDDHPYHIRLENIKSNHKLSSPSDSILRQITETHINLQPYLLVPGLTIYGIQLKNFKIPDKAAYQAALELILTPDIERIISRMVFGALYAGTILTKHITELKNRSLVQQSSLSEEQKAELPLLVLVLGLAQAIHQRGAERGWPYELVDQIRHSLTLPLSKLIKGTATIELDDFNQLYRTNTKVDYNRYPGCIHCNARCLYHLETERLVSTSEIERISNIMKQTTRSSEDKYSKIQKAVQDAVRNWLGTNLSSDENSIAYCTSLLIASKLNIDEYDQMDYSNQMAEKFISEKSQNT